MAYYDALKTAWTSTTQPPTGVTGQPILSTDTTEQKLAKVNGWTCPAPDQNTTGSGVLGVLYPRGSWDRVQQVASGLVAVGGNVTAQIAVICKNLVQIVSINALIMMQVAAVKSKIESDLSALMGAKMTDGKGILWAAGEYGSGDPGDQTVLLSELVNPTTSWCAANRYPGSSTIGALTIGDVQAAGLS